MSDAAPEHARPFGIKADLSNSYWQLDSLWSILASAKNTDGRFSLLDQVMPRKSGPPPHVHERWHEFFYLIDGEIKFQVGEEILEAGQGMLVSVPPGTAHSFAVTSETSHALNMYVAGGFEAQVEYTAVKAEAMTLPPGGTPQMPRDQGQEAFTRRSVELNSQRPAKGVEDLLAADRAPFPFDPPEN